MTSGHSQAQASGGVAVATRSITEVLGLLLFVIFTAVAALWLVDVRSEGRADRVIGKIEEAMKQVNVTISDQEAEFRSVTDDHGRQLIEHEMKLASFNGGLLAAPARTPPTLSPPALSPPPPQRAAPTSAEETAVTRRRVRSGVFVWDGDGYVELDPGTALLRLRSAEGAETGQRPKRQRQTIPLGNENVTCIRVNADNQEPLFVCPRRD